MPTALITVLLWTAALSSGLMAGVYFAFSGFIMAAFSKMETGPAIAAMNAINQTILRSSFMPVFFASSMASVLLVVVAFTQWGDTSFRLMLTAGLVYFVGMFICTAAFNVPLNKVLADINENSINAQEVWSHYLKHWTVWNHVRTVSSLLTCVLSIWLLLTR